MTVRTYLKNLTYKINDVPEPSYMKVDDVEVKVENSYIKGVRLLSSYFVDVSASIKAKCKMSTFFEINVDYSAMVNFESDLTSVSEFNKILEDDIPRRLYDHIRALVWNLSSESGLPPVMLKNYDDVKYGSTSLDDDAEKKKNDIDDEDEDPELSDLWNKTIAKYCCDDFDNDNDFDDDDFDDDDFDDDDFDDNDDDDNDDDDFDDDDNDFKVDNNFFIKRIEYNDCNKLSYEWLLNELLMNKDAVSYLNLLKIFDKSDFHVYQNLLIYKYYLRFIKPIEYHHPKFKKCDDSLWPMLLQMLFVVGKNVELVARKGKLPEIEFDMSGNERRTISSLKFHELKKLLLDVGIEVFVELYPDFVALDMDKDYADSLSSDNCILKEELLKMFRIEDDESDEKILNFVDTMFNRIKHYDLQVLPYVL